MPVSLAKTAMVQGFLTGVNWTATIATPTIFRTSAILIAMKMADEVGGVDAECWILFSSVCMCLDEFAHWGSLPLRLVLGMF